MKLRPFAKETLWGGDKLEKHYHKDFGIATLGETWELSTHPQGLCTIANGEYQGKSLLEVLNQHPEICNYRQNAQGELPILVKLIDSKKPLSIQVHPDDQYARTFENDNGKTEMWYVLAADEGAQLIFGFEHNMTKEKVRDAIENGCLEKYLHYENVHAGDSFLIQAGTVHAIGSGIVLAEVQQSSNVTYRLYDYNRVDKNGKKRELHVAKALDVLKLDAFDAKNGQKKVARAKSNLAQEEVCACQYFQVDKYTIKDDVQINCDNSDFVVILCINGSGKAVANDSNCEFIQGDCLLIPKKYRSFKVIGDCQLLKIIC